MDDNPPIGIEVDPTNGNFTYHPALKHVGLPPAPVSWNCDAFPFTVSFAEATPFDVVTIQSGNESPFETTQPNYRSGVAPGTYHYVVAVAVGGKVYVDAGCPGVEIP